MPSSLLYPHNPLNIHLLLPSSPHSLTHSLTCLHTMYAEAASTFTHRQAWGLVVRHERALRAISPRPCLSDAFDPVHRLFGSLRWLAADFPMQAVVGSGTQVNVALLRLLASSAASALKAAGHGNILTRSVMAGMASDRLLRCWTVCRHLLVSRLPLPSDGKRGLAAQQTGRQTGRQAPKAAAAAAAAEAVYAALFLLLPRSAVSPPRGASSAIEILLLAHQMDCLTYGPERGLRLLASSHAIKLMHESLLTVMGTSNAAGRSRTRHVFDTLGHFTAAITHLANQLVTQGCQGASAGSASLRNLLAGPLLRLLGSSLLGLLSWLQHVPTYGSWATGSTSRSNHLTPWGLPPLHQLPGTMLPDVASAPIVMQVRGLGSGFC